MGSPRHAARQLTPLELLIMKVLWKDGPSNVQKVQDKLSATPRLAYTTVQTMLNVLHRKGRVKRVLRGRAYEYAPLVSRDRAVSQAIRDMIDRLFGGSVDGLLMSLVDTKQLDLKKLGELRDLLEKHPGATKGSEHGDD